MQSANIWKSVQKCTAGIYPEELKDPKAQGKGQKSGTGKLKTKGQQPKAALPAKCFFSGNQSSGNWLP
jgi:hypothetical protein